MSNYYSAYRPLAARIGTAGLAIIALVGSTLAMPAGADMIIDFDFDSVLRGDEGTITQLASEPVEERFVGQTCLVAADAENQVSVHPGNDLIVSTGDSQTVILGVEDEANGGTIERYAITLGETIVIQLRFGSHAMSSLGFTLDVDCETPLEEAGVVTTIVPTTLATTTTVCSAVQSIDDQGGTAAIQGGCQATALCADGSVATPLDGSTGDGCPTTTTTAAPTTTTPTTTASTTTAPTTVLVTAPPASVVTCDGGATPVQTQNGLSCPVAAAVTDLPQTPAATPIVRAPAYAG